MSDSSSTLPARLNWALEILAPAPDERLLEIGCGKGILALEIARKLDQVKIWALDRSEKMIARALGQAAPAGDRLEFLPGTLQTADLAPGHFDKIFGFNVRSLWTEAASSLAAIRGLLNAHGQVYIFYQPAGDNCKSLADQAAERVLSQGFIISSLSFGDLPGGPAFCLIARPA